MAAACALAASVLSSVPRVEVSPAVYMPLLNFGFQNDHAAALKMGVRGLDTALTYGDPQQTEVGKAVRESGVPRSEIFVTTKIPCCPAQFTTRLCPPSQSTNVTANVEHDLKMLGLDYVDLMLVHWPCADFEATVATYLALEPFVLSGVARAIGCVSSSRSLDLWSSPAVPSLPASLARADVGGSQNRAPQNLQLQRERNRRADAACAREARRQSVRLLDCRPLGGDRLMGAR